MKKLLIVLAGVGVLIAGCASTQVIEDPGYVVWLTVGDFVTANPVDNELIGSYLRKELLRRGFNVDNNSPFVISGTIDVDVLHSVVLEARIVLKRDSVEKVVWTYDTYTRRKLFANDLADRIYKTLRE